MTSKNDPKNVSAGTRAEAKPEATEAHREKIQAGPAVSAGIDDPNARSPKARRESVEGLAQGISAAADDPGNQSSKTHRDPVESLARSVHAGGTGGGNQGTGERQKSNELKDQHLA